MGFNSGFKGLKKFRYLKIHYCFQRSPHLFLFWARLIQYKPSQPVSLRVILILSFRLPIGLSSGLFPSGARTAYFCALPNSTAVPSLLLPPPQHTILLRTQLWQTLHVHRSTVLRHRLRQQQNAALCTTVYVSAFLYRQLLWHGGPANSLDRREFPETNCLEQPA